jgi:hypothetical protein
MTRRQTTAAKLPPIPDTPRPKPDQDGVLRATTVVGPSGPFVKVEIGIGMSHNLGGSEMEDFNSLILRETMATIWDPGSEGEGLAMRANACMAALSAFKPTDEIEGMLAAQAVALHFGAMECFRRAMISEQPGEFQTKLRKDGANLARGMADMLEALGRKRGKGPKQVVRVERVVVHDGGQAIVGAVAAGTGRGEG